MEDLFRTVVIEALEDFFYSNPDIMFESMGGEEILTELQKMNESILYFSNLMYVFVSGIACIAFLYLVYKILHFFIY